MRNHQIKQILNIISDMHSANIEIKSAVDKKDAALVQNMLCELQDVAISIGNVIEESEGEASKTVSHIESYCETLYQILGKVVDDTVGSQEVFEMLEASLQAVENSVKNDIQVKKEIAFFPYKASMWDSLESIYFKLKSDPGNEVFCVPIPYYDLNPDRSFGQMHYEESEYPENVEVTDYRTYNFEDRCPDEMYIHNPYDKWNVVTSVDPRFYAGNLKKYTEKLVYSPYFVLQEIEPDDQNAIDAIKHFVWMPGVIYSDEVILQSEKMKQIYVNEFIKAASAAGLSGNYVDRAFLEKKFKGTGSPKIEKVINTKKTDVELPGEWRHLMEKSDGSLKKVVLYNTGITALLQDAAAWIDKIEDTLKVFFERRDEVVLWWRPHPLIETTMKTMKPEVLMKYEQIKAQYRKEGWGIFDDTSELERAIAISDAYYGDLGSMVKLYQAVGKPVLIQNIRLSLN